MLRHVVMWSLHDPANIDGFAAELRSCVGLVPGMREFDVGTRHEGFDANCDVVLVSTFDDAAALKAYVVHPHHQGVVERLRTMARSRTVIDFTSDGPPAG